MSDDDITLAVEGTTFTMSAKKLQDNSDFFKAMLSGRYSENNKKTIEISMVPAFAMNAICIFLKKEALPEIPDVKDLLELARCAFYLQMKSFLNLVNVEIAKKLTIYNWLSIYNYAVSADLVDIFYSARNFGLSNFNKFRSEIALISNLGTLVWYLSHVELNAAVEYNVFLAGVEWLIQRGDFDSNDIVSILYSLDFRRLTRNQIKCIQNHSLLKKYKEILYILKTIMIFIDTKVSEAPTKEKIKTSVISQFGKDLYYEIAYNILFKSNRRSSISKIVFYTVYDGYLAICTFCEKLKTIEKLTELKAEENVWGNSIVCWRDSYIISVCGQLLPYIGTRTRFDSARFKTTIDIFDCTTESWTVLSSLMQPRRHAGVTVDGDDLYVVGGTGAFRKRLNSIWVYKIVENKWKKLPDLPNDCSASRITVAVHNDCLYAYCNTFMFLNLKQLTWHELDISGSQNTVRLGSMVFDNNLLYFGCESSNLLSCYNLDKKTCTTRDLPGAISALCKGGRSLYALCEASLLQEDVKRSLIKIDLEKGKETELLRLQSHAEYPIALEKISPETGFFMLQCFDAEDKYIISDCDKKMIV